MLVVTELGLDGMRRWVVDTARRSDARRWEELVSRVPAHSPPYRAAPGMGMYHVRVEDHVILVSEPDLTGPLRDLVLAVVTGGTPA